MIGFTLIEYLKFKITIIKKKHILYKMSDSNNLYKGINNSANLNNYYNMNSCNIKPITNHLPNACSDNHCVPKYEFDTLSNIEKSNIYAERISSSNWFKSKYKFGKLIFVGKHEKIKDDLDGAGIKTNIYDSVHFDILNSNDCDSEILYYINQLNNEFASVNPKLYNGKPDLIASVFDVSFLRRYDSQRLDSYSSYFFLYTIIFTLYALSMILNIFSYLKGFITSDLISESTYIENNKCDNNFTYSKYDTINNKLGPHRLGVIYSCSDCFDLNEEISILNRNGYGLCKFAGIGVYRRCTEKCGNGTNSVFKAGWAVAWNAGG